MVVHVVIVPGDFEPSRWRRAVVLVGHRDWHSGAALFGKRIVDLGADFRQVDGEDHLLRCKCWCYTSAIGCGLQEGGWIGGVGYRCVKSDVRRFYRHGRESERVRIKSRYVRAIF